MSNSTRRLAPLLLGIAALLTLSACDGVAVNYKAMPPKNPGYSGPRVTRATYATQAPDDGSTGAFRINCSLSHQSHDDPIVFPNKPFATHLHSFYGNGNTAAATTTRTLTTSGNSTCTGGTLNRSAYWAPSVLDARTGNPAPTFGENALQVYYKTGYQGADPRTIQRPPTGLKVVAGSAKSTAAQSMVRYSCEGAHPVAAQATFPNCAAGDRFIMSVEFPACWDGRNLDSPDHKAHMAYGTWGKGCPSSHPVAIPVITQNYRYVVPNSGMRDWRLASDMYSGPAGYSGHADLWVAWDTNTMDRVVRNCLRTSMDCRMNLLGDGEMLY
ncbi:MAG: DUF1996 domain-containing protein [Actinobacteria bacterium]|nr:DUF1996 domain-containing protein [Actinomycetota bacterium]